MPYLTGKDGIYHDREGTFIHSVVQVDQNPHAKEIKESVEWIGPKVPEGKVKAGLRFAEEVYRKYRTEATWCQEWNPDTKEWGIYVPPQWNQSAHCCSHPELEPEKSKDVVILYHTHPWGSMPCHSGEDIETARKHGNLISVVVSGFTTESWRPSVVITQRGVVFKDVPASSIYDKEDQDGEYDFPLKWLDQVHADSCPHCTARKSYGPPRHYRDGAAQRYIAPSHWPPIEAVDPFSWDPEELSATINEIIMDFLTTADMEELKGKKTGHILECTHCGKEHNGLLCLTPSPRDGCDSEQIDLEQILICIQEAIFTPEYLEEYFMRMKEEDLAKESDGPIGFNEFPPDEGKEGNEWDFQGPLS